MARRSVSLALHPPPEPGRAARSVAAVRALRPAQPAIRPSIVDFEGLASPGGVVYLEEHDRNGLTEAIEASLATPAESSSV